MKTKYILTAVTVLIFVVFIRIYVTWQKDYYKTLYDLNMYIGVTRYSYFPNSFYDADGVYPKSLDEIFSRLKLEYKDELCENDLSQLELYHFKDVFSKTDQWVGYIPLYDESDKKIVSFLIISAGIDGKIDYKPVTNRKLHINDWKQNVSLYNPDWFDSRGCAAYVEQKFNVEEKLFGKKDLLIYAKHLLCY